MIRFKCAYCGEFFNSKKYQQECCSLKCRYKLMGERQKIPLKERLLKHTQKTDGCWIFVGCKDPEGYGSMNLYPNGKHGKMKRVRAHRVSWEVHNGPIPEGMCICHRCDNPPCVNPDHLFLGTHDDNRLDAIAKGRHAKGERVTSTCKLTAKQVLEIREKTANGARQIDLAKEYGIDRNSVYRIIIRQSWKHI